MKTFFKLLLENLKQLGMILCLLICLGLAIGGNLLACGYIGQTSFDLVEKYHLPSYLVLIGFLLMIILFAVEITIFGYLEKKFKNLIK